MKSKTFVKALFDNILIIVLAIAIAILLWIVALRVLSPTYEREYSNIPVERIGCVSPTGSVDAVFSATKEDLYRYGEEGVVARIDLTGSGYASGDTFEIPLRFYVGEDEILPKTPVIIRVTVTA